MFATERAGLARPTLFFLHYLGGSALEWGPVAWRLSGRYECVALDLAGFGAAANVDGYTVADMALRIAGEIAGRAPKRWMLVGHSMGAKVAAAIARASEDGARELAGLTGLVFVAGSPPSPEPMGEDDRTKMLGWLSGDQATRRARAREYVEKNSGPKRDARLTELAVDDVLRANPAAWQAWLASGSREDWSQRIGVLNTPALVIAGADDDNLGPDAQHRLTVPHYAHVHAVTLPNAKHLPPLECPDELATLIDEHAERQSTHRSLASVASEDYRALIDSDRVSRGTRRALLERAREDDPAYAPQAMNDDAFATLTAVLDRVVPQAHDRRIDLAARIDRQLAANGGDGWRFAALPPDAEAYRAGLATLNDAAFARHERSFRDLSAETQDALLDLAQRGEIARDRIDAAPHTASTPRPEDGAPAPRLSPSQMKAWFEDVRADAVKLYVAHPNTLAGMGYSGIANGGDGIPKSGFVAVGIGEREAWEPIAARDIAPRGAAR
jgi:pimeloyl-ACP methyl ester carboxylesterase